jgi:hypothetical protein
MLGQGRDQVHLEITVSLNYSMLCYSFGKGKEGNTVQGEIFYGVAGNSRLFDNSQIELIHEIRQLTVKTIGAGKTY